MADKPEINSKKIPKFRISTERVSEILTNARKDGRTTLLASETSEIFKIYGIKNPKTLLAKSLSEVKEKSVKIGFPLVMKVVSPDIVHKSDIGGIQVGLKTPEEVEQAFVQILENAKKHRPKADIYGVDVQEMAQQGKELIIGCSRDVQFGPLIMFGAGGIFVNYLKDISFRLAPLSRSDVVELIDETKIGMLLKGVRGESPSDIVALQDTILRISQLVTDFDEIVELDINPAFAYERGKGLIAVDVKITIGGE